MAMKREATDMVRLFEIVESINRIGMHLLPIMSPTFIALMAIWRKDGRPASITSQDEAFSPELIEVLSLELEKICSHAIDIVELAQPILAKTDETRAFLKQLHAPGGSSVN